MIASHVTQAYEVTGTCDVQGDLYAPRERV